MRGQEAGRSEMKGLNETGQGWTSQLERQEEKQSLTEAEE